MQRILTSELTAKVGEKVMLKGWVQARRDHGKLIFLDLRDRSGLAQIVVLPKSGGYTVAETLRSEFVVEIVGQVNERPANMVNTNIASGTVEVLTESITILNVAKTPPFELDDTLPVNEEVRLKYRYLDLRNARMARNIRLRDQVIQFIRSWMHKNDFVEIETPILMKGTPEGSREYIVPSRLHEGKFYVLPQSPQQFKQLLMIAGFERYFQIARCFRDEDQRGDRQPEFTQLDFEMSFVEREDVLALTEQLFHDLVVNLAPEKHLAKSPFPRLTYAEAMEKYGTDKPDLRVNKADPNELAFCWIVEFPMFEKAADGRIAAVHHPFCSVLPEDQEKLVSDPFSARANAYDLVLNGYELSSGSIRIHNRELQKQIFDILEISEDEQNDRFGHMLEAFEYGAPPHGGFAPGIDRIVMLLAGEPNIREVIAFPKTGDARDPMMGAPSMLPDEQLKEVSIALRKSAK
jgi:aspartyl-tRNA synthetase